MEFSCKKTKVMFIFSVNHQKSLCVFLPQKTFAKPISLKVWNLRCVAWLAVHCPVPYFGTLKPPLDQWNSGIVWHHWWNGITDPICCCLLETLYLKNDEENVLVFTQWQYFSGIFQSFNQKKNPKNFHEKVSLVTTGLILNESIILDTLTKPDKKKDVEFYLIRNPLQYLQRGKTNR